MIPKIIHYCWFGGNPLPDDAKSCIESWKKNCPDYEIREWNESNFDLNCCSYVRQAYEAKKWAFITDYVRLYAMVNYGGIYMDTDVEVRKPLDSFLKHQAFSGFQEPKYIPTGIMACEKGFPLFKQLLDEYDTRVFVKDDGSYNTVPNTVYITDLCLERGLELNNKYQVVEGFALYPVDYFCAKSFATGMVQETENTYTIHHFAGSWYTEEQKRRKELKHSLIAQYGSFWGKVFYKIQKTVKRI